MVKWKKFRGIYINIINGSYYNVIWDVNPTGEHTSDGNIALFGLYMRFYMTDELIKLHHTVLVNRCGI